MIQFNPPGKGPPFTLKPDPFRSVDMLAEMKSVIEGYRIEFSIREIAREEDTNPKMWARMGGPFYRVRLYDSYLDRHIEGYIEKSRLDRIFTRNFT